MKVTVTNWVVPACVFVTTASTVAAAFCWHSWSNEVMEHKKLQLVAVEREVEVKKTLDQWNEIKAEFASTKEALFDLRQDKAKADLRINKLTKELDDAEGRLDAVRDKENQAIAEKAKEIDELNKQVKDLQARNVKLEQDNDTIAARNTVLALENEKIASRKSQLQNINSKEFMQAQIAKLRLNLEGLKKQRAATAASGKVGKDFDQIYQGFDQQERGIEAQIKSLEFRLKNAK